MTSEPVGELCLISEDVESYVRSAFVGDLYDIEIQDNTLGTFIVVWYNDVDCIYAILDIRNTFKVYQDSQNTIWYMSPAMAQLFNSEVKL